MQEQSQYDSVIETACLWALERESVRVKKEQGLERPWTQNEFLLKYRFCNVNRQHDKETVILNEQFFKPNISSPDLWFNVAIARWINWSPSILAIGWTDLTNGYDADDLYRRMASVGTDQKFFTGAYLIRGCTNAKEVGGDPEFYEKCKNKRYFLAHVVFKGIYEIGPPAPGETLESYHSRLTQAKSNGHFMAGQQIADLKYYTMKDAPDWTTWAPIGPGPVRFLNRLHGRPLEKQIPKAQHYEELLKFFGDFKSRLPLIAAEHSYPQEILELVQNHIEDAHNLGSNVPCEVDKIIRLSEGGKVRSLYDGQGSSTTKLI